jgi:hypothetical protein
VPPRLKPGVRQKQMSLFNDGPATDPFFRQIREQADDDLAEAKALVEPLATVAAPYLDSDLRRKARSQFHQSFWEIYLVAAMLHVGIDLVPRRERARPDVGPDIQVRPAIWVEAVTVSEGTQADAVPQPIPGTGQAVPDEKVRLRLLSALKEKSEQYDKYRRDGVIGHSDVTIVAINAALVPYSRKEQAIPRIVKSVFGVGVEAFLLNSSTMKFEGSTHIPLETVAKASGSPVSQQAFLDGTYSGISACLYSSVDAYNRPERLDQPFVLVHNPTAKVRLALGAIPLGREYWVQDQKLAHQAHGSV